MKKTLLLLAVVVLLGAACTSGQNNIQPPTNENTNINTENSESLSDQGEALTAGGETAEPQASATTPQAVAGLKTFTGPAVDGYGCRPYAGYQRSDDLRVCVNPLVVQDENVRRAVKLAVDNYRPWYSLTVLSVTPGAVVGDYTVVLEAYDEKTVVNIENWTIQP